MDSAREQLEQKLGFDRVRKSVCDHCQSSFAASLVLEEEFSSDEGEIRRRLLLTEEMRLILMFEDTFPTAGYIDTLDFLMPLQGANSSIDVADVRKLRTMLDTASSVARFFEQSQKGMYPNLKKLSSSIVSYPEIVRRIDSIIDHYGNIKDNASEKLAEISGLYAQKQALLSQRAAAVLRRAVSEGIVDSGVSVSVRDGHMLIPVPSAAKHKLNGFIYDESASGKTVFIEPAEVVELSNQIRELQFEREREIVRILFAFSDFIRPYIDGLLKTARFLGTLDFLLAKAQTALDMVAGMPVFSDDGTVRLRKARHPILEKALRREGKSIVPVSIELTPAKRILLVSGPNAGGKSVCLKTMGLLQYMFQWGMLIPTSESSEMVVFKNIEADIGDDQSLDNDLSTYSSFLVNMKGMMERASSGSLVLIDEFGSGTEPAAGGAIAEAILSFLESKGVYGVITTHYTNLKLYASRPESSVINGAMAFDAARIQPLYKLETGLPGNSFAFEMARKTGIPEPVVQDAEHRAGVGFVDMERNLRKIARSRKALDDKLERVSRADRTLEGITDKYQKELSDINEQRRRIIGQAQQEARGIIEEANRRVENTIRIIRESQAEREQTMKARASLQDFLVGLTEVKLQQDDYVERKLEQLNRRMERNAQRKASRTGRDADKASLREEMERERREAWRNAPLNVGEKVRVKESGIVGEVSGIRGRNLTLTVGNISTKVPANMVERISSNEYREAVKETVKPQASSISTDPAILERKLSFRPEIDLRGSRLNEAIDTVTHYLDDAIMLGVPQVRIVHGKGDGILHCELQKFIRTIPAVSEVRDEQVQFGGSGVTIVKF